MDKKNVKNNTVKRKSIKNDPPFEGPISVGDRVVIKFPSTHPKTRQPFPVGGEVLSVSAERVTLHKLSVTTLATLEYETDRRNVIANKGRSRRAAHQPNGPTNVFIDEGTVGRLRVMRKEGRKG